MNTTTIISVKIDKDLKEQASKVANELGFSLSAVIKANLKKLVRERKIEVNLDSEYNPEFMKSVLEAEEDYKNGINFSPPLRTAQEIEEYLMN